MGSTIPYKKRTRMSKRELVRSDRRETEASHRRLPMDHALRNSSALCRSTSEVAP